MNMSTSPMRTNRNKENERRSKSKKEAEQSSTHFAQKYLGVENAAQNMEGKHQTGLSKSQKEQKVIQERGTLGPNRLSFMPRLGGGIPGGNQRSTLIGGLGSRNFGLTPGMSSKQQNLRGSNLPGVGLYQSQGSGIQFDAIDFSKPDKHLKEVFEFLQQHVDFSHDEIKESPIVRNNYASNHSPSSLVNFAPSNLSFVKKGGKFSTISGNDA